MSSFKNLADVQKQLLKMGKDVEDFVKAETVAIGFDITRDAKTNAKGIMNAPVELGNLISNEKIDNGYGTRITQNFLPMGAYMEFGTGAFVEVADEWRDMAWTFYKNGKGMLRATPYLYPAFTKNREKYLATLKKKLEILTK
jgi:hypothetical protein